MTGDWAEQRCSARFFGRYAWGWAWGYRVHTSYPGKKDFIASHRFAWDDLSVPLPSPTKESIL